MDNPVMSENSFIAKRQNINRAQKAWKFLRDVSSTSLSDLSRTAVKDGSREYTYGLMFREWDRYASVFSALGLTGENHSRTGILGSTCAEVIFSFYGLNMTGAEVSVIPSYSALTPKKIIQTVRNEHLTDFIVTDDFAQPNLINDLLVQQKELGLRHVIVLHVPLTGVTVHRMLTAAQETKYAHLKSLYGPVCMDELLKAYGNHPVCYAPEDSADNALILHTSGTTGGAPQSGTSDSFSPFDPLMKLLEIFFPSEKPKKKTEEEKFEIPEPLMKALLKYGNRITSIPNGRKSYPFDFED